MAAMIPSVDPPSPLREHVLAAHARACAKLRARGAPSPHAPSSLDLLKELHDVDIPIRQAAAKEYARVLGLPLADV